ncbi:hypothetical protein [Streptomyces alkaliterrae]|uniref:Uncharacterized protein n=1 Tax=Streptomyces alkaliterrae TaxID=2213162 RepID=A0A5P0YRM8_9ACTN|nr:hypothetical protein [Streptomyces alkaliterrae]MBB1258566.1 hypothetical protein [Streptomyces alkaliterrae]MQS02935.1 hypothetical protein [Streptomyces alkaliterrae]
MTDVLRVVTGNGQKVEAGEEFAPLSLRAETDGGPAGGLVVSFHVDDPSGTGTGFHGGSPVMVTTDVHGGATTDVPLVAGDSGGTVSVLATAGTVTVRYTLEVMAGDS